MGGANQRGDALTKATQGADGSLDPSIDFLLPSALPLSVLPAVRGRRVARGLAASVDVAVTRAPERHRALGSRERGAHGGPGSRAPPAGGGGQPSWGSSRTG